jgi:hypothetical protein
MYLTKPKSEVGERVARMKEGGIPPLALTFHESGPGDMGRPNQKWVNEEAVQDQEK